MYKKIERIHFIGIGGIGMSGIAELMHGEGFTISGSDMSANPSVHRLESMGIEVFLGHKAQNVEGAQLVVHSSAISAQNAEIVHAKSLSIPVIRRAQLLAELMRLKHGIAVAGSHGKTTTTSLISMALVEAGRDPTVVVGGRLDNFGGTNARKGKGEFMVVEADESDGTFNSLSPSIAIVTNLDREHLDHYKSMKKLRQAFESFLLKVPFYGLCVLCEDDPELQLLRKKIPRRIVSYGMSPQSDYQITHYTPTPLGCEIKVWKKKTLHSPNEERFELQLPLTGKHNALNAVAALVVCDELECDRKRAIHGLSQFSGVERRFQVRGIVNQVTLIDDYAHHPTEIRATLEAARDRFGKKQLFTVFQPHRYSRTLDVLEEFSRAFDPADEVSIVPIYSAGETPIEGLTHQTVVDTMKKNGFEQVRAEHSHLAAMQHCLSRAQAGDVILTLGAGDLPRVYQHLL